jgi:hypothetical protein
MDFKDIDLTKIKLQDNGKFIEFATPIKFSSPKMYLPFGIEKEYSNYVMKLQFRGMNESDELKEFYKFILKIETVLRDLLKVDDETLKTQLRPNQKYDPILITKIPQQNNKFLCEALDSENVPLNITLLNKGFYTCVILIDSIWKIKGKYYYKLKVKNIRTCV